MSEGAAVASEPAWRPQDEALLRRLLDEEAMVRLWQALAPQGAAPPHPRASGMIALLRAEEGGELATHRLLDAGDAEPLRERIGARTMAGRAPALLHHLALWHGRLAAAHESAGREDAAVEARLRSLAAWIALAAEPAYLRTLGVAVAGGALPEADVLRAVAGVTIDQLEALAGAGVAATRATLRVLRSIDRAVAMAGVDPAEVAGVIRQAAALRVRALDARLGPIEEALREASARQAPVHERAGILARAAQVWRFGDEAEEVERFAIEQAQPLAWEAYRGKHWDDLRAVLGPIVPLMDRQAQRIEQDPTRIAYAAHCAQLLMFRGETESTLERQVALLERAVAVCATHRNARLILADLLVERARRALASARWAIDEKTWRAAKADVDRAGQLWQETKTLAPAREELDRALRYRTAGWKE